MKPTKDYAAGQYSPNLSQLPEKTKAVAFHDIKIPPPPCFYQRPPPLKSSSRRGFRKQDDDPFLIAYKECTKTSRKGKFLGGLSKDDFGYFGMKKKNNNMSVFSCKHSCSVREESVINLSQLPISRSLREKRGLRRYPVATEGEDR